MSGEAPYDPQPTASSDSALAPHLLPLIEPLAANTHEIWARTRVDEGWSHGPEKDTTGQRTPFLVPFAELPEAERELDRTMVRGTLGAALALGCVIEPPPTRLARDEERAVAAWEARLEKSMRAIRDDPEDSRSWNYDLDDEDEIESAEIDAFPALRGTLLAFQERLYPAWKKADARASELNRAHRAVALWAIWPGIAAIVLGAIRAEFAHPGTFNTSLTVLEFAAASIAAAAVARGFLGKTRDRWLAARQASERLRVAKFRALADESLWSDSGVWHARWSGEVALLEHLDPAQANAWVSGGSAEPRIPEVSAQRIPAAELAALSAYYRSKRQEYQHHYFHTRAEQHRDDLWMLRLKLPILLFVLSVVCVLVNGILALAGPSAAKLGESAAPLGQTFELGSALLVMAAILPVIGFGLRAWFSAFELPRRAHLFESKARELADAIRRMHRDRCHPRKTFTHIELGEHFFESEHREWCRLILEAEWFV
jgi:RyR domain